MDNISDSVNPGSITLLGSGETSSSGRKIFEILFKMLPPSPKVVLLETPSGFELNSAQVIQRVADFMEHRLQNFDPKPVVIPARKRGTRYDPDNPVFATQILDADLVFMGPGSPTYAVRQLKDSLVWDYLLAYHRVGGMLAFSSAAIIAISAQALPVYEIYKVGEDLHWQPGLDLFASYGLSLSFIPHWNNFDGGAELDTSHCFMGRTRFNLLLEMLPPDQTLIGIDEHTALNLDCAAMRCNVLGLGSVILIRNGQEEVIETGDSFALSELGDCFIPGQLEGLPHDIWKAALNARRAKRYLPDLDQPPPEVVKIVTEREAARKREDWSAADNLRDQLITLGWQVADTPDGPQLKEI
jgi:hypothetical protein